MPGGPARDTQARRPPPISPPFATKPLDMLSVSVQQCRCKEGSCIMRKWVLLLAILFLSACSSAPGVCPPKQGQAYSEGVRDVARRFDDAVELAQSTPRVSLAPIVSDLQAIRRDAEDIEVPDCAADAQDALIAYMDSTIDGFRAFLASEADASVNAYFDAASRHFNDYQERLDTVMGVPSATPRPTSTPGPTATSRPTATPSPTVTPGPSPADLQYGNTILPSLATWSENMGKVFSVYDFIGLNVIHCRAANTLTG